jgi:hypothetical protein
MLPQAMPHQPIQQHTMPHHPMLVPGVTLVEATPQQMGNMVKGIIIVVILLVIVKFMVC